MVAGVVCVDVVVGFAVLAVVGACVGTIPLHRSSLWHRGSKVEPKEIASQRKEQIKLWSRAVRKQTIQFKS